MFEIIEKYNFWKKPIEFSGFERDYYLNKIKSYTGNNLIKIIVGQRRVGKSYILRMTINYLITKQNLNPKNILYINKDLYELNFISDSASLISIINEYKTRINPIGKIYLFIDEIQEISQWEKTVNSLSQDYITQFEIFITGSNSNLLSNELASYLTGRYIQFEVFPFSFTEYSLFFKLEKNKTSFLEYLKNGGMPETLHFFETELKKNYISSLKESIILKDIVARYKIRDPATLERLIDFLIDSVGSFFSTNKIVNYLNSNKIKTNNETIGNYLKYIEDSFLIHSLEKYDIKGKEILLNEKKYYLNDMSFKYFLTSGFDFNPSRYLENIIYVHLRKSGYNIYIGSINGKEIDFIAEKNGEKKYIQVCYLLSDDTVISREFGNLEMIKDNFDKTVISFDDFHFGNRNGIKHIPIWEYVE